MLIASRRSLVIPIRGDANRFRFTTMPISTKPAGMKQKTVPDTFFALQSLPV
jgi:hypothetical protein